MSDVKNKSNKRKKEKVEFTAENIDSTAPVKKILEELQHTNTQAYMFYSRNIKQRHTTHKALQNYHCVVPGFPLNSFDDDWDGELNIDYFEPFCYKSLCPKMISTMRNIEKPDPVTSYIKYKIEWQRTCRNLKLTATLGKMAQKYESLNDEVVHCPKHIVDIAAHIDSDPDPYFDSPYNWYYTGNGNLQLICIDWTDYLLYSEFSTVYLSQFSKEKLFLNSDYVASFDCGKDYNILETICSAHNIIVLRTKYKIFILKIIPDNCEMRFETVKCVESESPYTSVSFDDYHKNILYVTTLDYKLSIVNLDRIKARTVKLKGKLSMIDNWSTVIGSGRRFYTHVGRKSISIYDKCSNNSVFVWKELRNITDEIACNDISVAKFIGESSLYFGTDHHLFLMDIRNLKQNGTPKVVQRWTHGMESVPTYISHTKFEMNKELLVLSSQWCEDMCVLPNCSEAIKDTNSGGLVIPYRPPNILSTLDEARQKMLCNDLYNPVDARLCTAITGALIMERGEKYDILMQNSLGDITCHTLFPEYMDTFMDNEGPENLHEWSTSFKLPTKEFEVSSIENIASIWKQLKKVPDNFQVGGDLFEGKSPYNEAEIFEAFENEEIDSGLLEVWMKGHNETVGDQSSFALNLYLSDDEKL